MVISSCCCILRCAAAEACLTSSARFACEAPGAAPLPAAPVAGDGVPYWLARAAMGVVATLPDPLWAVIARLLGSIVLGCGLVSAGVKAVATTPKFSLTDEQFDQSTFAGRFAKMLTTCDPSTLFASKGRIERAVAILARKAILSGEKPFAAHPFKATVGDVDLEDDAALWQARKLKEAAVHPDTGDIIPRPFRMAGYGELPPRRLQPGQPFP
jgi:hypothetical protein